MPMRLIVEIMVDEGGLERGLLASILNLMFVVLLVAVRFDGRRE